MIRNARLDDVPAIRDLINSHAELDLMLFRSLGNLYESLRDFKVYEQDGQILGCCALQIIWADLAEIKSLAVLESAKGQGIGRQLVNAVLNDAKTLQIPQVFSLTLEEGFFAKLGFQKVHKDTLPMKVWSDCIRCPKQDHCDEIAMIYKI